MVPDNWQAQVTELRQQPVNGVLILFKFKYVNCVNNPISVGMVPANCTDQLIAMQKHARESRHESYFSWNDPSQLIGMQIQVSELYHIP